MGAGKSKSKSSRHFLGSASSKKSQIFDEEGLNRMAKFFEVYNLMYTETDIDQSLIRALNDLGIKVNIGVEGNFLWGNNSIYRDLFESEKVDMNRGVNAALRVMRVLVDTLPAGTSLPSSLSFNDMMDIPNIMLASGVYIPPTSSITVLDRGLLRTKVPLVNRRGWNTSYGIGLISLVHEFGHHVDFTFGLISDKINIKDRSAVSPYGDTDSLEAFAEAFVLYCLGTKPQRGIEYYRDFEQAMESAGLSAFKQRLIE